MQDYGDEYDLEYDEEESSQGSGGDMHARPKPTFGYQGD